MKFLSSFLFLLLLNFNLFSQDDYYWVGGSGNWSDINNWQLENGSTPFGLPNETNSVIFNENSFVEEGDYVDIDNLNVYCYDMIWENIPFDVWFTGNNEYSTISISGSLKFHENVINEFYGKFRFDAIVSGVMDKTIELNGFFFNNEIYFIGILAEWELMDDLFMSDTALTLNKGRIYLEHGSLNTNGHDIHCASFLSNFSNIRNLNIQNSTINLYMQGEVNCWDVNHANLNLQAEGSTIIIHEAETKFVSSNGIDHQYCNLQMNGLLNEIENNGQVCFNKIQVYGDLCDLGSNISADSVIIKGNSCSVGSGLEINNLIVNGLQFILPEGQTIKRLISDGQINILGPNYFEYGRFSDLAYFLGDNTFDTLILLPSYDLTGSHFYFQSGSTQTIIDSLRIRGNQCSNISLMAIDPDELAYLRKDFGEFDISCDFLHIHNVGAQSETLNFYAGENSIVFPNPDDPPPGWIFENASNYTFGFSGTVAEACWGDTITIDATCFNGDEETKYYWNADTIPGEITYAVWEPQTVQILVAYAEDCFIADYIVVEFDSCENNLNDNLYNSLIKLYPNPSDGILNLEIKEIFDDIEFSLCNSVGIELFRTKIKPSGLTFIKSFDCSFLVSGIYYAQNRTQ